ncbi:hypothetical protein PZB74_08645 [Porifericola rhodea]|uniref:hypothetical protein n=1 Tax=Porifericola rhodea TaxID=930972 RepID=UPI002666FBA1|nr:hypothetical protein [Porifericola rhodea]WKN33401.1 hypothetical protein PZB74_08645 [Porifericola rhodea]
MPQSYLHILKIAIARGVLVHLLLLYTVGMPLHLLSHTAHEEPEATIHLHQDHSILSDNSCLLCDWWVKQDAAPSYYKIASVLSFVEYDFATPTYHIPYTESLNKLSSRAPPVRC